MWSSYHSLKVAIRNTACRSQSGQDGFQLLASCFTRDSEDTAQPAQACSALPTDSVYGNTESQLGFGVDI